MADITIGQLASIVISISAFLLAWKNVTKPFTDFDNKIKGMEERIAKLESKSTNDYAKMSAFDSDLHLLLKVCYNLLEHEVTGNHTESMTRTLEEMKAYMLEK